MKNFLHIQNKSKITNRLIFQDSPQATPSAPSESGNPAESKEQQAAVSEAREVASSTVTGIFNGAMGRAQAAQAATKKQINVLASLNIDPEFDPERIFQKTLGGFHPEPKTNNENSET